MHGTNGAEPLSLQLSQEEVLAILDLLEASYIPGLEDNEVREWPSEKRQFALSLARRVLQSRGLAQVQDGTFQVHRAVLTAVGVCAYSPSAAMIYHWPDADEAPASYFAHLRGSDAVFHSVPAPSMHLFSLLSSKQALIDAILDACEYRGVAQTDKLELVLSRSLFSQVRELAESGQIAEAHQRLVESEIADETAREFIELFVEGPRVSIFQTLKQQGAEAVHTHQFTLLQSARSSWLVMALAGEADGPLLARTVGTETVRTTLDQWL